VDVRILQIIPLNDHIQQLVNSCADSFTNAYCERVFDCNDEVDDYNATLIIVENDPNYYFINAIIPESLKAKYTTSNVLFPITESMLRQERGRPTNKDDGRLTKGSLDALLDTALKNINVWNGRVCSML
jgi:hypothetical protein